MKSVIPLFWPRIPLHGICWLAVLSLSCLSTEPVSSEKYPEELPVLMQALRKASSGFKSALVIDHREKMPIHAEALHVTTSMLIDSIESPLLLAYARPLNEKTLLLRQALNAGLDRDGVSRLFNDLIASCIECHHRFRGESGL